MPSVCAVCVCCVCVSFVCAVCVCRLCVPSVCAVCVCRLCVPSVCAICVCRVCVPSVCAVCVCRLCVPSVCAISVCRLCRFHAVSSWKRCCSVSGHKMTWKRVGLSMVTFILLLKFHYLLYACFSPFLSLLSHLSHPSCLFSHSTCPLVSSLHAPLFIIFPPLPFVCFSPSLSILPIPLSCSPSPLLPFLPPVVAHASPPSRSETSP